MNELQVPVADLDNIRTTLGAVMQYLQAEDIAQAQRQLKSKVEYSRLTQEVVNVVNRVEHIMKDFLLEQHDNGDIPDELLDDPALD